MSVIALIGGRAIAILMAGSSAGPLLGVPGGTWLGQQAGGWRLPFLVLAGLGIAVSAVILMLMPHLPPGSSDADRGSTPDAGRYASLVVKLRPVSRSDHRRRARRRAHRTSGNMVPW